MNRTVLDMTKMTLGHHVKELLSVGYDFNLWVDMATSWQHHHEIIRPLVTSWRLF